MGQARHRRIFRSHLSSEVRLGMRPTIEKALKSSDAELQQYSTPKKQAEFGMQSILTMDMQDEARVTQVDATEDLKIVLMGPDRCLFERRCVW